MADFGSMTAHLLLDTANWTQGIAQAKGAFVGFQEFSNKTIGGLGQGMKSFGQSLHGVGTNVRQLGTEMLFVGAAMTGATALMTKASADFESAIVNATTVTGKLGDEFDIAKEKMSVLARELGEKTVFSATQAADAMYDLASKGLDPASMSFEEMVPFLNLASSTQADLKTSTEVLTSTMRAFGLATTDTKRIADTFVNTIGSSAATIEKFRESMAYVGPIARTAGISLEETAASLGRIYDLGFPASMAGTALRRTFAELMTPSTKLVEVLDKVGLKFSDINLESDGLAGTLKKLDEAGMSNIDVMNIFGQRAGPMVNALRALDDNGQRYYETIGKMTEANIKAQEGQGRAAEIAQKQLETLKNTWTIFMSKVTDLAIEVGNVLLPIMKDFLQNLIDLHAPIKAWIMENKELIAQIGKWAMTLGPIILGLGALLTIVGALLAPLGTLISTIGSLVIIFGGFTGAVGGATLSITTLVAAIMGPVALIAALGALAVILGVVIGKYIEMRQAEKRLAESQEEMQTKAQDRLSQILERTYEEAKATGEVNEKVTEQIEKMKELDEQRQKLLDKKAEGKRLTDDEIQQLQNLSKQLLDETNTLEILTGKKKDHVTAIRAASVEANKEFEAQRKLADTLASVGIEYDEFVNSTEDAADALGEVSKATEYAALKQMQQKNALDETREVLEQMVGKPNIIDVEFGIDSAREFRDVVDEIRDVEQALELERAEGHDKQILRLRFELEEKLRAIDISKQELRIAHDENIKSIKEQAQEERDAAEAKKESGEISEQEYLNEIDRIDKEAAHRIEKETEYTAKALNQYDLLGRRHGELTTQKLKAIGETIQAEEGEFKALEDINEILQTNTESLKMKKQTTDELVQSLLKVIEAQKEISSFEAYQYGGRTGGGTTLIGTQRAAPTSTVAARQEEAATGRWQESEGQIFTSAGMGYRKYQGGTAFVPRTGPYILHEGERVTPRGMAEGGGFNITIINQVDSGFINDLIMQDPNAVINVIGSDVARGGTVKKSLLSLMRGR